MAPRILVQNVLDVTIVDVQASRLLEGEQIDAIGEELYRLVEQMNRKKLVLDFSKVQFLASAAVGMVMNLHKKSTAIKGTLILCGVRKEIMRIFEIMSLTKLLRFCADEKEALAAFGYAGRG
jgi:anti-sigma B factor antagonist